MADLSGYTTKSDYVTLQPRDDTVLVPSTPNVGVGDVYQIGGTVYNIIVGQKVLYTGAYFFSLASQNFAAVHKDNVLGDYVAPSPP
jgi:hypothetical protein